MIHKGTQEIEATNLILRKFKIEDTDAAYNGWFTDSKCNKYLPWDLHVDINETHATLEKWIDEYYYGSYKWAIELKNTHELIGMIGTEEIYDKYNYLELSYIISSNYWGNGYGTEALKAIINYFFNECDVHLIEAKCMKSNLASIKVMEKSGMIKDASLKDRRINKVTNKYEDLVIYSIINE